MKKMMNTTIASCLLAICLLIFASCEKETKLYLAETTDLTGKSMIKVYSATLNATRNYVYVDNLPVTGAGIAYGGLFPSVSFYSVINGGSRTINIKDTLISSTQRALTFTQVFEPGANYTILTYDTTTATKHLVVRDNIVVPSDTSSRLRFTNLIYSRTAVPNVDIYSQRLKANIFTNVAPATVTEFTSYPSEIADTLFVRAVGTTTNLTQLNGFLPREKRNYTIVFRGIYQLTTGTLARTLTSFTTY